MRNGPITMAMVRSVRRDRTGDQVPQPEHHARPDHSEPDVVRVCDEEDPTPQQLLEQPVGKGRDRQQYRSTGGCLLVAHAWDEEPNRCSQGDEDAHMSERNRVQAAWSHQLPGSAASDDPCREDPSPRNPVDRHPHEPRQLPTDRVAEHRLCDLEDRIGGCDQRDWSKPYESPRGVVPLFRRS